MVTRDDDNHNKDSSKTGQAAGGKRQKGGYCCTGTGQSLRRRWVLWCVKKSKIGEWVEDRGVDGFGETEEERNGDEEKDRE
jgi:hypothetical protein